MNFIRITFWSILGVTVGMMVRCDRAADVTTTRSVPEATDMKKSVSTPATTSSTTVASRYVVAVPRRDRREWRLEVKGTPEPNDLRLVRLFRYDVAKDKWVQVPQPLNATTRISRTELTASQTIPAANALYYAVVVADDQELGPLIYNGPVLPNDLMAGPAPIGKITAPVPVQDKNAVAVRFVPDPALLLRGKWPSPATAPATVPTPH